jgi:heptosyltransferase-2
VKILLIQTAFIGDVILATPVIEALRKHRSDVVLDVLVRKGNEGLLGNNPGINKILIWDKKTDKYSNFRKVIKEVRSNKYDIVINLQRFASTGIITALSKAKKTIGYDKNPFSFLFTERYPHIIDTAGSKHEVDRNLSLLKNIIGEVRERPAMYPSKTEDSKTLPYKSSPYICMAPSSVWFTKQLPFEQWVKLIKKKVSEDPARNIYLLGAKGEAEYINSIIAAAGSERAINLAGQFSFLDTASLMRDAQMNYVNDSAPLHIASAMNANVTAFFCSTVPAFGFGPLSDHSTILQSPEPLSCRPCGLHGHRECPKGHFRCGYEIKF